MNFIFTLIAVFSIHRAQAVDMGFRFQAGFCHKERTPGFNPEFFGECGNLTGSRLINKTFNQVSWKAATLNSSYIYASHFKGSNLYHLSIRRGTVIQSDFKNTNANYLDLRGSTIKGVNFEDSFLSLLLASGTRFVRTSFKNCALKGANFWGSNLQEVDFSGSDLSAANLTATHILFTNFKGAKFDARTKLPFSEQEALKKGMIKID